MSDSDKNDDDTWEDFFGAPTELMPSILGALDAIIESNRTQNVNAPRKSPQVGNFANLSPCVQKILANVPDQELNKRFNSEETLGPKRGNRTSIYRSLRSPEKHLNRSNESLDIISPNVQKMISNFPDAELVLPTSDRSKPSRNGSFLHSKSDGTPKISYQDEDFCDGSKSNGVNSECDSLSVGEVDTCDSFKNSDGCYSPKPLGSYLHTSHGIASRTPVGRKNMGKYLQVPSETSVGTSSTTSSEVSRPVSLTSLGSCSSSGSSGPHQPNSAYLASAESLDSDPEPTGSQGSADSGIAEQPTMSPEARVLQEVLDTETVYVADLNEVIQGYLVPWKEDPDCLLSEHLPHLFSNLEEIYRFNRSFLDQLRGADFNPTKIANVFIQNDSGFAVYNEYCTNYPRTMEVLSELTRDEKMASLFREKQMALSHALPLGSYLLKPVQRILKYHLLLQRLSKQCDPDHKPAVDLALATMTAVASSINSMKRKHEHAVRVHEIQSQLYGWTGPDLTTLGELIAEGTFRVNGARGRRHVFLFDKVLLMAKNKQDGALAYKSHIECSNLMLVEQVRGEPLSFQILPFDNPRLQCTLRARSPQNKREWTLQIKRVILENYSAVIPNHARQLVMQLGQDVQETEDTTEKWSPLNKNSTPHYLERRSRVRKSRDLSNRRASSQDRAFPSLGSWRRKSEPSMGLIPQYTAKTIPKKISKLKKAKESGAKFYTDLSDSENYDVIGESNESLAISANVDTPDHCENSNEEPPKSNNLEKIVTDLLMQNEEFHKALNRQRRTRASEPEPPTWFEEEARPKLPSKADSLPRSFQLNDQIDDGKNKNQYHALDESLKENPDPDEQHENDLASQLDDNEYPEHKIYRKTAIRFSLLQRIRTLMSEEEKRTTKYPLHKQGSKSMGEKIAHPDYADPQKLFNSCSSSRTNLSVELSECEMMKEPERLDMTISEKEVLNEFEKRLNNSTKLVPDTGQDVLNVSSQSELLEQEESTENINSSQNSDSYYESILDKSLVEEYTKDENGRLVAKQDSFKGNENCFYIHKFRASEKEGYSQVKTLREVNGNSIEKKTTYKRPTKAPPPIPVKPSRLVISTKNISNVIMSTETIKSGTTNIQKIYIDQSKTNADINHETRNVNVSEKSWVKTMVGRFE
ncbi:pleckstrin homology domain-containing family G member 1 isoform X2 [Tribolium madens]|uniref:pleckstrin homology domain-containing family G member 1 isoform X2 n=1 Tax=Tribolium madens TaxID=41895 RepID=UPI001CF75661|nr:pleckstrin homology domain-containing family G member 1 isoform X2 [Tribolium madens]